MTLDHQRILKKNKDQFVFVLENLIKDKDILNNFKILIDNAISVIKNKGKILFFGNGGSAADSQHLAAEFVSRFSFDRDPLPSIALTVDTSVLTAISNDYGYQEVFSRQVKAIAKPNDLVIGLTTSGKSINVLSGLEKAHELGAITFVLTGSDGINNKYDYVHQIKVPSNNVAIIQQSHILIGHTLCECVENAIFRS